MDHNHHRLDSTTRLSNFLRQIAKRKLARVAKAAMARIVTRYQTDIFGMDPDSPVKNVFNTLRNRNSTGRSITEPYVQTPSLFPRFADQHFPSAMQLQPPPQYPFHSLLLYMQRSRASRGGSWFGSQPVIRFPYILTLKSNFPFTTAFLN